MDRQMSAAIMMAIVGTLLVTFPVRAQTSGQQDEERELSPEEKEKARKFELLQDKREKIIEMREQRSSRQAELTFNQADAEADGFLSRQEAVDAYDWAAGLFKVMDQDGDKKISRAEFQAWGLRKRQVAEEAKTAAVFAEMDRLGDHDGKVSLKEWWGAKPVFEQKDADKDGVLTGQEFLAPLKTGR